MRPGPLVMVPIAFLLGMATAAAVVFLVLDQIDACVPSPGVLGLALYGPLDVLVSMPVAVALQVFAQEIFLPRLRERRVTRPGRNVSGCRRALMSRAGAWWGVARLVLARLMRHSM